MAASEAQPVQWDAPSAAHRHRHRHKVRWSPDQFLDPLALVATAPLAFFPERFPPMSMAIGLAILLVPYLVRQVNTGRAAARTPALWPLLFLLMVGLPVGAYVSPAFWAVSWPELVRAVWGIAVCLGVLHFCVAGGSRRSRHRVKPHVALATAGFFAVGVALGGVAFLSMRPSDKLPLLGDLAQWLSAMSAGLSGLGGIDHALNPNRVASTALVMLTPALLLLVAPHADRRIPAAAWWLGKAGLLGAATFFGGVLLLSQSRTALLSVAAGTVVACLVAGRRGWILLGVGVLMGVAVLSVFSPQQVAQVIAVKADAESDMAGDVLSLVAADPAIAGRRMIWARAWHAVLDAPLTGVGLDAFQLLARQPYPDLPGYVPDIDTTHAHNMALQLALDVGIPGLLAYVGLVVMAVSAVLRLLLHSASDSTARLWAAGMAGALVVFLVSNTVDAMTLGARPAVTQWYLLGMVLGAGLGAGEA